MKIEAYINMMADLRAEIEELKERLNHIESKLKSIKQQLAPKKYQFSANEKTILRSLSEEWNGWREIKVVYCIFILINL